MQNVEMFENQYFININKLIYPFQEQTNNLWLDCLRTIALTLYDK